MPRGLGSDPIRPQLTLKKKYWNLDWMGHTNEYFELASNEGLIDNGRFFQTAEAVAALLLVLCLAGSL